jgi:hypothetical protein
VPRVPKDPPVVSGTVDHDGSERDPCEDKSEAYAR